MSEATPHASPEATTVKFTVEHPIGGHDCVPELYSGDGLVEIENDRIRLTELGRLLMRVVAAVFDRYLEPSTGRHARAV